MALKISAVFKEATATEVAVNPQAIALAHDMREIRS
jgi:hypothetical protein